MEQIEVSLREAVQMVADGRLPKPGDPCFQSVCERLEQAETRGLVSDFKFEVSSSRESNGRYLAISLGRITGEGRDFVSTMVSPQIVDRASLQKIVDDFYKSRIDLWNQRHDDRQREANREAARRGLLNSSEYFRLVAAEYAAESVERIGEIKRQLVQQMDCARTTVETDKAERAFEHAASKATSSLRNPLDRLIQQRGLNSRISAQLFDDADRRIAASIKAAVGDVRSHANTKLADPSKGFTQVRVVGIGPQAPLEDSKPSVQNTSRFKPRPRLAWWIAILVTIVFSLFVPEIRGGLVRALQGISELFDGLIRD